MLASKGYAQNRPFPQAPVLADLARAERQIGTTRGRVNAVTADFVAGVGPARFGIERVQADQHLIDDLLVTKGLHDACVVARQVDYHIGTTLEGRFYPQHAQAGVTEHFTGHARLAVPDRGLELEHDLVAPAVVGALDRTHVLRIQRWRHLDFAQ